MIFTAALPKLYDSKRRGGNDNDSGSPPIMRLFKTESSPVHTVKSRELYKLFKFELPNFLSCATHFPLVRREATGPGQHGSDSSSHKAVGCRARKNILS